MRIRLLTGLLSLGIALGAQAQTPRNPRVDPTPIPLTNALVDTSSSAEDPIPIGAGSDEVIYWESAPAYPHYFDLAFIYWETTDPNQDGAIIRTTSTNPSSRLFDNGYSTRTNTDPEMGFRATLGHRFDDIFSAEIGGHWVHPYEHPETFTAGLQNPAGGAPFTDFVFLVPNNDEPMAVAGVRNKISNAGFETNGRAVMFRNNRVRVDGLLGLHFVQHVETFDLAFTPAPVGALPFEESFEAENSFFGPQLGAEMLYRICEYASIRVGSKLGVTANFQDLNVAGPAAGSGRFTGANNLGTRSRTEYSTLVDFGAGAVFRLTPNITLNAGYSALWFSTVLRATDQLGLPGVVADGNVPAAPMSNDTMLIGGFTLSLGVDY